MLLDLKVLLNRGAIARLYTAFKKTCHQVALWRICLVYHFGTCSRYEYNGRKFLHSRINFYFSIKTRIIKRWTTRKGIAYIFFNSNVFTINSCLIMSKVSYFIHVIFTFLFLTADAITFAWVYFALQGESRPFHLKSMRIFCTLGVNMWLVGMFVSRQCDQFAGLNITLDEPFCACFWIIDSINKKIS